jgi:16S rRNA C967 or C1407 C5-methylase (RsmB/RsmF family)/NOL1/NOP2/fmu family ribosome biogenesis protein
LLGTETGALLKTLDGPSPTSIRLDPWKPSPSGGAVVPWCSNGRYLEERPIFTLDPLLHAGAYYVQEASSMLLEQAVNACGPLAPDTVALDLCAAPGGKSTHLATLLPREALLVCNEPVRARQAVLMENLWKWGRPDTVITGSLPEAFAPLGAAFDLIVVDAPCSGEGMFRKDPFARAQWSDALVEQCAVLQAGIIDSAWKLLKPSGHLIYCTCTWEPRENEHHIERLIHQGAEHLPIPFDPAWGMVDSGPGLRCYPHRVKGEGLFIAALRKPGQREQDVHRIAQHGSLEGPFTTWVKEPERQHFSEHDGLVHALSSRWTDHVKRTGNAVRMLAPGIPVAQRKGKEWAPHAALALNTSLDRTAFPEMDLGLDAALRFLRGESLPAHNGGGRVLMTFRGMPLGWGSGAGNRWNNGWPSNWRIRMR